MRNLIRRRPFLTFYAAAVLIGLAAWIYLLTVEVVLQGSRGADFSAFGQFVEYRDATRAAHPVLHHHGDSVLLYLHSALSMPILLPMFSFPFAPTLAALLIVGIGWKREGLRRLLSLYKPVRGSLTWREGLQRYAVLACFLVTFAASLFAYERLFGDPARVEHAVAHVGLLDWRTFFVTLLVASFFNQGALLEELGWRGFAQPLLTRRWGSPLLVAVALGVLWALWHFPREIPGLLSGGQTLAGLVQWHLVFFLSTVGMTIVAFYFVNVLGGSVVPAIIIHGTLNQLGNLFGAEQLVGRSYGGMTSPVAWAIAGGVVVALVGPDLGWRTRIELLGDDDPSLDWSRGSADVDGSVDDTEKGVSV